MCGRYASVKPAEAMRGLFHTVNPLPEGVRPSWNIAPSRPALVVRFNAKAGGRHLDALLWGLVPHWVRDLSAWKRQPLARAETAAVAPAFRGAFAARRALVPMDAFYEWHGPRQRRLPFAVARHDREAFAVAGLWESWVAPGTGKVLRTFAIITVPANKTMAPIHDRMPAILAVEDWPLWLGETAGDPAQVLRPAPDDLLEAWRVGLAVNKVENNGPELLAPLTGGAVAPS